MDVFKRIESEVRGYCRSYPVVFETAKGSRLFDEDDNEYIDFLAGAGTLNYGHNNPLIKEAVLEFIESDGLLHGLDMHTKAKETFLETFESVILRQRGLNYKIQFTGPTGTNAVEAAMKLARKVKARHNIVAFTNGFHGVTFGALAATGNSHFRNGSGMPLNGTAFMPYDGFLGPEVDTLDYFEGLLEDKGSGVDHPAAVIVETVQGEGGVNVASVEWLQQLQVLCHKYDMLLIVDDIQMGCGRTGTFFSFEEAGIYPDLVTLSKSLSAYGLPMSVVLMKPGLDQWKPGEHNGTFRGNNLAFASATAALRRYWTNTTFSEEIRNKSTILQQRLEGIVERYPEAEFTMRGRGLIYGLASDVPEFAEKVSRAAFERNLIIETSGSESHVVKFLPPLVIEESLLKEGLGIVDESVKAALNGASKASLSSQHTEPAAATS